MLLRVADERLEARRGERAALAAAEQLRARAAGERRGLWGGLLGALRLDRAPLSVQDAAAAVARHAYLPADCYPLLVALLH